MTTSNASTALPFALPQTAPSAARAVFRLLKALRVGTLDVQLPDGTQAHFGSSAAPGEPRAAIRLHDWRVAYGAENTWNRIIGEQVLASDTSLVDFVQKL